MQIKIYSIQIELKIFFLLWKVEEVCNIRISLKCYEYMSNRHPRKFPLRRNRAEQNWTEMVFSRRSTRFYTFTLWNCVYLFYALMYANNFPYLLRAALTVTEIYACSENVNGNQVGNKCRVYICVCAVMRIIFSRQCFAAAAVISFCFARLPPLTLNGTRFSFPLDNFTKWQLKL